MAVSLIECPACGHKVSSQATTCPQCGHPIRPVLHFVENTTGSPPRKSTSRSALNGHPLNLENGLRTLAGMIAIIVILWNCLPALLDDYSHNDDEAILPVLFAMGGYLLLWGWNAFIALKHNDTGKIVILTFLPFIGILFCSFLMPEDQNTTRKQ